MVNGATVDWLMKPPRSRGMVLGTEVMAAVGDVLLVATVVAVVLVVETLLLVSSEGERERYERAMESLGAHCLLTRTVTMAT